MAQNLAMIDDLGSPKTYNHYPNGWAMAFNTPFKMWKRYEFNGGTADPRAKTARRTQFYSMLGSRSIWHDGWKAVTTHVGAQNWGDYANDTWELYNTTEDRSECHDVAAQEPGRLRDLVNLWYVEAGAVTGRSARAGSRPSQASSRWPASTRRSR